MTERDPKFAPDLSARARRGLLSEAEEQTLEEELERDPELRVAHLVGLDLDRSTAVRVGDEALIARAADRALERVRVSGLSTDPHQPTPASRPSTSPARRRRVAMLVAAALVCATGMAAGMWATGAPRRWFAPKTEAHAGEPVGVQVRPAATPPSALPVASSEANSAEADTMAQADTPANAPRREHPAAHAQPEATAAALFKSANLARHDGDFSLAERLYSQLIGRYPSSDEAALARVSLGKLLLASGDPSDAEREFGQYLQHQSGVKGQLAEEALVSRAESFEKMGRANAERATWQRLLSEYPKSVYAAEAKGRLGVLGGGVSK